MAVKESEAQLEPDALTTPVREIVPEGVMDGDRDMLGDAEFERTWLAVRHDDDDRDGVTVVDAQGDSDGVREKLPDTLLATEAVLDTDGHDDTLKDAVPNAVIDGERDVLGEGDALVVALGEEQPVGERDCVTELEPHRDAVGERDDKTVTEPHVDGVGECDDETDIELQLETRGEGDIVGEPDLVPVMLPEMDGDCDILGEAVTLLDLLGVAHAHADTVRDVVTEEHGDVVDEKEDDKDEVAQRVPRADKDDVRDEVTDTVLHGETDVECEELDERVCETDLVGVAETLTDLEVDVVTDEHFDTDDVREGATEALLTPVDVLESEGLCVKLGEPVALGDPEGDLE